MFMNILHLDNIRSGNLASVIAFALISLLPLATYSQDAIEESAVTESLSHHESDGEDGNGLSGNPPGAPVTGNPACLGGGASPVNG